MMTLKKKAFKGSDNKRVFCELKKNSFGVFTVLVNGDEYYKSCNELFAVQRFNAL